MTTSALPVGINSRDEKDNRVCRMLSWQAPLEAECVLLFLWDRSYIREYWIFFYFVGILVSYTSITNGRWCILLELCTRKHLESSSTFFSKNSSLAFQWVVSSPCSEWCIAEFYTRFISEGRGLDRSKIILSLGQSCDFSFLRGFRGSTKDLKNKWVVVV